VARPLVEDPTAALIMGVDIVRQGEIRAWTELGCFSNPEGSDAALHLKRV